MQYTLLGLKKDHAQPSGNFTQPLSHALRQGAKPGEAPERNLRSISVVRQVLPRVPVLIHPRAFCSSKQSKGRLPLGQLLTACSRLTKGRQKIDLLVAVQQP